MEEKRKKFVNFMSSGQQKHSFVRNCEAWKFWHEVSSTFVKRSLFNENTKEEMQKRKIVDIKKINCEKMEKVLSQMGEAKQKNAETDLAEFYLLDLELGHFNAIRFLLGLNGNGEKWKFSEFLDFYQLPKESNFAFQLRILHINNAKEKLIQIKKEMKQLLDGKHWAILEFEALTYLAPGLL
ncbi:hypothetical protein niasHS_013043 [Heterodera schachtii]|uniref:Uncharacterized protein n=1 Tax=Heterodera schachtii TaxID=97005 RepID=A0ABD2IIL9_HETSC